MLTRNAATHVLSQQQLKQEIAKILRQSASLGCPAKSSRLFRVFSQKQGRAGELLNPMQALTQLLTKNIIDADVATRLQYVKDVVLQLKNLHNQISDTYQGIASTVGNYGCVESLQQLQQLVVACVSSMWGLGASLVAVRKNLEATPRMLRPVDERNKAIALQTIYHLLGVRSLEFRVTQQNFKTYQGSVSFEIIIDVLEKYLFVIELALQIAPQQPDGSPTLAEPPVQWSDFKTDPSLLDESFRQPHEARKRQHEQMLQNYRREMDKIAIILPSGATQHALNDSMSSPLRDYAAQKVQRRVVQEVAPVPALPAPQGVEAAQSPVSRGVYNAASSERQGVAAAASPVQQRRTPSPARSHAVLAEGVGRGSAEHSVLPSYQGQRGLVVVPGTGSAKIAGPTPAKAAQRDASVQTEEAYAADAAQARLIAAEGRYKQVSAQLQQQQTQFASDSEKMQARILSVEAIYAEIKSKEEQQQQVNRELQTNIVELRQQISTMAAVLLAQQPAQQFVSQVNLTSIALTVNNPQLHVHLSGQAAGVAAGVPLAEDLASAETVLATEKQRQLCIKLMQEIKSLRGAYVVLQQASHDLQKEHVGQVEELKQKLKILLTEITANRANIVKNVAEIASLQRQLQELQKKFTDLQYDCADKEEYLQASIAREQALTTEVEEIAADRTSQAQEIVALRAKISAGHIRFAEDLRNVAILTQQKAEAALLAQLEGLAVVPAEERQLDVVSGVNAALTI